MSQIIKSLTSGPVPPTVATTYVTDVNSPAIPAANILNVLGNDTTDNDLDGIRTDGSSGSNTLTVQLTNRITGTATTTDGVTTVPLYSFSLGATPGTYQFTVTVTAYNLTDSIGAGYTSFTTIRTTGGAGVLISGTPGSVAEEGAMSGVSVIDGVTGNNHTLDVIGLAGKTIHWVAVTTYVFVS